MLHNQAFAALAVRSREHQEAEQWEQALEVEEQLLAAKERQRPDDTLALQHASLNVAELQATLAQERIHQNRLGEATHLLNRAQRATKHAMEDEFANLRRLACRAHVYNCSTCVQKAQGDVQGALQYGDKALGILGAITLLDQLPPAYLNLSALYSSLGLHSESLKQAFFALEVLKQLVQHAASQAQGEEDRITASGRSLYGHRTVPQSAVPQVPDPSLLQSEREHRTALFPPGTAVPQSAVALRPVSFSGVGMADIQVPSDSTEPAWLRFNRFGEQLAICYFNIAVEQEYLSLPTSLDTYRVAVETGERHLGKDHPLTGQFRHTMQKAERSAERHRGQAGDDSTPARALDMSSASQRYGAVPRYYHGQPAGAS